MIEDDLKNQEDLKNEGDLRNEDHLKNEDDLKNEEDLKNEVDLKIEDNFKNWPIPQKHSPPPLPLKSYLIFFWWLPTVTATPLLMFNRKLYQASKPEMEFHMIDMIYAALHTWRLTYSALRLHFDLCPTS